MSILSQLLDPIFGSDTRKEDAKAQEYLDKSVNAFDGISAPELENPELFQYLDLGSYDPTLITTPTIADPERVSAQAIDPRLGSFESVANTAYDNISVDPRLHNQQMGALDALDEIIQGGGLTAADKAALNQAQTEAAQADRGRREAILQNMQARGMGGGGMELLAQLQSSQAATDRANQAGLDIAGIAQQRALDAIMQSGQLAGQMDDRQFGQQAQVAQAKDAINQFNALNKKDISLANAGFVNDASKFNSVQDLDAKKFNSGMGFDASKARADLSMQGQQYNAGAVNDSKKYGQINAQDISNKNIGVKNQYQQNKPVIEQQKFENQTGLASGRSQAAQPGVSYYQGLGDRKTKKDAAYMDAVIKGSTAAYTGGK